MIEVTMLARRVATMCRPEGMRFAAEKDRRFSKSIGDYALMEDLPEA